MQRKAGSAVRHLLCHVCDGCMAGWSEIEQAKKSPVVKPGFKRILETGVSRGSKETTRALYTGCVSQRLGQLSG